MSLFLWALSWGSVYTISGCHVLFLLFSVSVPRDLLCVVCFLIVLFSDGLCSLLVVVVSHLFVCCLGWFLELCAGAFSRW